MKYLKILSLVFCTLFFAVNCKAHAGVKQIETKYNVKIGVYAIDTNNGNSFSYMDCLQVGALQKKQVEALVLLMIQELYGRLHVSQQYQQFIHFQIKKIMRSRLIKRLLKRLNLFLMNFLRKTYVSQQRILNKIYMAVV